MKKNDNERNDNMKIRCKNCYRVLNENEDYCTSCGEYSAEMAEYMRTGVRKVSQGEKLSTALIFFAFIAFIGTGAFSIGASIVQGEVGINGMYELMGKMITSLGLVVALTIAFRKELKGILFKANLVQTIFSVVIGLVASAILIIVSTLTNVTKIIPQSLIDFIPNNKLSIEGLALIFVLFLVTICEEYIYRHRLVNYFDEDTMLNDFWIVVLTVLISTILSFAWFMSLEILIMTFLINVLMTLIYINTNKSLGINIIIKMLMYLGVVLINYIV